MSGGSRPVSLSNTIPPPIVRTVKGEDQLEDFEIKIFRRGSGRTPLARQGSSRSSLFRLLNNELYSVNTSPYNSFLQLQLGWFPRTQSNRDSVRLLLNEQPKVIHYRNIEYHTPQISTSIPYVHRKVASDRNTSIAAGLQELCFLL